MGNKKIFSQKYGITGFVFMLDAIDGKNRFEFNCCLMQQNSATLIYELNTMKDTVEIELP